jgi:hypothetical protein
MIFMNIAHFLCITALSSALTLLSACSVDKLEARLQADPQCKSVMNSKTGALMPCPGTDKEFYKSIPDLNASKSKVTEADAVQASISSPSLTPKPILAPVECKPQLHQKSGSLMPCPSP